MNNETANNMTTTENTVTIRNCHDWNQINARAKERAALIVAGKDSAGNLVSPLREIEIVAELAYRLGHTTGTWFERERQVALSWSLPFSGSKGSSPNDLEEKAEKLREENDDLKDEISNTKDDARACLGWLDFEHLNSAAKGDVRLSGDAVRDLRYVESILRKIIDRPSAEVSRLKAERRDVLKQAASEARRIGSKHGLKVHEFIAMEIESAINRLAEREARGAV